MERKNDEEEGKEKEGEVKAAAEERCAAAESRSLSARWGGMMRFQCQTYSILLYTIRLDFKIKSTQRASRCSALKRVSAIFKIS